MSDPKRGSVRKGHGARPTAKEPQATDASTRREEDEAAIARILAKSPLEEDDAKQFLVMALVVVFRAISAIRRKIDEDVALSDETRALPALIARLIQLCNTLKVPKEALKGIGLDLDLDEDEVEGEVPTKPVQTSAQTPTDPDDDDLLAEIRGE